MPLTETWQRPWSELGKHAATNSPAQKRQVRRGTQDSASPEGGGVGGQGCRMAQLGVSQATGIHPNTQGGVRC